MRLQGLKGRQVLLPNENKGGGGFGCTVTYEGKQEGSIKKVNTTKARSRDQYYWLTKHVEATQLGYNPVKKTLVP